MLIRSRRTALFAAIAAAVILCGFFASNLLHRFLRSEVESIEAEVFDDVLDASVHHAPTPPRRLASFIPPPLNNGPGYYFQGQVTAGAGAFGPFDIGKEPVNQCVVLDAGTTGIIATEANIAPGEVCDYDALADFTGLGVSSAANTGKMRAELLGTMIGGVCTTPDGGSTADLTLSHLGANLSDAGLSFVSLDAGVMGLQAFTPITACVGGALSAVRRLPSWQGQDAGTYTDGGSPQVLQVYPSSVPPTVASPTTIQVWLTLGAAPGVTGIALGATALTNVGPCANGSLGCVQGTLAAGSYSSGPLTVSITSATQTIASCSSSVPCFQVANPAPTLASVTSNYFAGAVGLDSVSVVGTNFAGTCTLTLGTAAAATCTVNSGTSLTCTTKPVAAAGAVNGKVTCGGNDSNTVTNVYTYVWDPSLLPSLVLWVRAHDSSNTTTNGANVTSLTPIAGSYSAALTSSATFPTYNSSWTGSRGAVTFTASTIQFAGPAFTTGSSCSTCLPGGASAPLALPGSVWARGQYAASVTTAQLIFDGLSGCANRWEWDVGGSGTNIGEISATTGSFGGSATTTWETAPWDAWGAFVSGTGQSSLILNGGSAATGTLTGTLDGPTIGGRCSGTSNSFHGNIGEVVLQAAKTASGDQTSMASYRTAYWGY